MSTTRATGWLAIAGVLALALWARLAVAPAVMLPDGLAPGDSDSEYHLRLLRHAVESFPRVHVFDPLLGWPQGQAHPWAPGFDWLGAAWILLLGVVAVPFDWAAALFPVVLGMATIVLVIRLTRALLPPEAPPSGPLLAGVVAAITPQFIAVSRLGRTDHHGWEALSVVLLLGWVLSREPSAVRREVHGALVVFAAMAGFVGAPLYVALAVVPLAVRSLWTPTPAITGSGGPALIAGGLAAALVNLGPIAEHGRWWVFGYPSLLQPLLAVLAGLGLFGAVAAHRFGRTPRARAGLWVGAVAAIAGLLLITPGVGTQLRAGLVGWLVRRDPWLAGVSEFQSLFTVSRDPLEAAATYFGLAGFAAALGLVLVAARRRREPRVLAWAFVTAALLCLTLLQVRFGRVLAPMLAIAFGLAFAELARSSRLAPLLALTTTLVLVGVDREVQKKLVLAEPRPPSALEELSGLLRLEELPRPGQRAGVLASWEYGSTLLARAQRPVIASGFGSYVDPEGFELSQAAFARGEAELVAVLDARDLGFVVHGAAAELKRGPVVRRDGRLDAKILRERPAAGATFGGNGIPGVLPHFERLMPIAASSAHVMPIGSGIPALWLLARVEGAPVQVACGDDGVARLTLEAAVGPFPFRFTAWRACAAGETVTVRLAVPTGATRPGFRTDVAWVAADGQRFTVPEASIVAGSAVNPAAAP